MGIKKVLEKGVESIFGIMKEAVVSSKYVQITEDNGFDEVQTVETPIRTIVDSFSQEDMKSLSFADNIQPTDLKCLIPGSDLGSVVPSTQDNIRLEKKSDGTVINKTYALVDFETDAMNVLYTVLLRDA